MRRNFIERWKTDVKFVWIKNSNVTFVENFSQKKLLKTHIGRDHHQNEPHSNVIEKPKIDKVEKTDNNRTLLVGPFLSGKTNLMLKTFPRIRSDRDNYKITKTPPEQYSNFKIKIKEKSDEIKAPNEHENAIIVFDDILGSSNSKYIDQNLTKVDIII